MNFFERTALKIAFSRLEDKMGSNWKGKAGAIVAMLGAGSLLLAGVACTVQAVSDGNFDQIFVCWKQVAGGATAFGAAFSLFGIRHAIGTVGAPLQPLVTGVSDVAAQPAK